MHEGSVSLSGRWRLWDQVAVRGAGFPADGVLRLAPEGLAAAADKFGPRDDLSGGAWKAFEEEFTQAAGRAATSAQEIAASGSFRAAVAWQNRGVLDTAIRPFLNWSPTTAGRTFKQRQREELVAHYWQRFCVKNDTIGFFGPVGWGAFDPSRPGMAVDPGTGLTASSEVFWSSWSVDSLAREIDTDPALRPWTAPRRVPFVRLEENAVRTPARPPRPVAPETVRLLRLCDGTRSVPALQREMGPGTDVPALLDDLVRLRWITWRLDVPADIRPDRRLRACLERIGEPALRAAALARMDELQSAIETVRAAAEDPERLVTALSSVEQTFQQVTDAAAKREKSTTTAPGRAVVYSDSRRAARVTLGSHVLAALAPLDLLMSAAAWLSSTLAARVTERVTGVYERLRADAGPGRPVDLAAFWFACMPVLHGAAVADADGLQAEFERRWQRILPASAGVRRVSVAGADIAGRVAEVFGSAGAPGWAAARYMSPDVMIAAEDASCVERGEFHLTLGELHLAANTLGNELFVNQHPDPRELFDRTDRDHPAPRLMPLLPKEHKSRLSARIRHALVRPQDYQVALLDNTADPYRDRTVPSADAVVERRDGRLCVVLPDGAVFPAVEVFAHVLTTLVTDRFRLLPEADHSPRVTIDRMTVARETWRFTGPALAFADDKSEARRFVRHPSRWGGPLHRPRTSRG
ncbi:lantibiotic dehydratase [Streptomyces phaeoluteigriseus]|uniref:Lantibiotic dehydratase n=1 Tax=Streptomyces phaeoluteigriseus TaxID=114686 RepID=A0A1V6MRD4_9ACTN|nr:lantibiotic dehydratase [Streptomyces phaeoluteigriseus]OQD54866.1 lantibiotic dehydratase [Streptomyces phaeoluteigriseus]